MRRVLQCSLAWTTRRFYVLSFLGALAVFIYTTLLIYAEHAWRPSHILQVVSTGLWARQHWARSRTVDNPASRTDPFRSVQDMRASGDIVPTPDDQLQRLFLQQLHRMVFLHSVFPCFRQPCNATFTPEEDRLRRMLEDQFPIEEAYKRLIDGLADQSGYADIVFITAASSNHFKESKGMFWSMRQNVFPQLRNQSVYSFKVIYYDLGLDGNQIKELQTYRELKAVIRVPFERLPGRFTNRYTCGWKPLLILANILHSKVTIWMDASTRFNQENIIPVVQHALDKGVYAMSTGHSMPLHVDARALHYFHVQPCLLSAYNEIAGGFLAFRNDRVIRQAVLGPWVSCAFSPDCLCPGDDCYARLKQCNGTGQYSICHRFDQATLGVILVSLYDWRASSLYGTNTVTFVRYRHNMTQWLQA